MATTIAGDDGLGAGEEPARELQMIKHSVFARDFSAATRRALLKKGIAVIGTCAIPDMSHPMPYANASRGYELSNDGQFMIRTHAEVRAMAGAS